MFVFCGRIYCGNRSTQRKVSTLDGQPLFLEILEQIVLAATVTCLGMQKKVVSTNMLIRLNTLCSFPSLIRKGYHLFLLLSLFYLFYLFIYLFILFIYGKTKVQGVTRLQAQPISDTKRKRKQTNPNKRKSNKCTNSTKISSLFPKRGNSNAKGTETHKNKISQCKT